MKKQTHKDFEPASLRDDDNLQEPKVLLIGLVCLFLIVTIIPSSHLVSLVDVIVSIPLNFLEILWMLWEIL